ncbi:MAG: acetolactate synthase, large subunit, biosynthetic type [Nitrospirae bacterium GWC2_56_14]|nr:MAG: acetolactate synthase, large subunit, biosynthetic type [Nitrospirae bacterium GWC2_56_14]
MSSKEITGAEIFLECLKKEKVDTLFCYPGGVVLKIFDVLYGQKDLRIILPRHEQGGVHMADGYARSTGKVGVALVTSGPGATNVVTGLATAYMDSIPLVVFTGQVPTALIGNDAFQEADIVGITRPCTKYNFLVKDVKDIAQTIKEAFYIASTGRPGPVLIDLPRDVVTNKAEFHWPDHVDIRSYKPSVMGNKWQIKQAAEAIAKAKKPVAYIGGGVILSNAAAEVLEFAEITKIPVTHTLMGIGGFPGTHPLSLGMLGMHGTYYANMAIHNSDLIVAIGARFDDRVTGKVEGFAPEAKIVHIDVDPTSIRKNVRVDIPIVGDVRHVMVELNKELHHSKEPWDQIRKSWSKQIEAWREERPLTYEYADDVIKPQFVIEKLNEVTRGDAIIVTDVGQHQMWAAQYFKYDKPRDWLSSGGLGTMGYGFPAAIGAKVANPKRDVFCITGDGGIQMNVQELATAVENKIPVKVVILNNRYLGMVRQWQELFYQERYSSVDLGSTPDFVKLAEAYGAIGLRATKPSEVVAVLQEALKAKQTVFMDFVTARYEKVFPMVPAGASINEMIFGEEPKKEEKKLKAVK